MSKSVDEILKDVLKAEGGYTNDSDDRGGPTKYGVTIHTMRRLGMDLNGDGRITASDVKMLTVDQALEIFKRDYFFKPRISQLPDLLHDTVLDMQINSGSNAVKLLQRLVNKLRVPGVKLKVDGAIGPNTIAGVEAVIDQVNDNRKFWNMYGIARRSF
jgi:lysozyme family protein